MNQKQVEEAIGALQGQFRDLQDQVNELLLEVTGLRDGKPRGPKVERPMTAGDAFRVKFGDLKGLNHKEASEALGLSYGQVFSCRGGYTFKQVKATAAFNADGTAKVPAGGDDAKT